MKPLDEDLHICCEQIPSNNIKEFRVRVQIIPQNVMNNTINNWYATIIPCPKN